MEKFSAYRDPGTGIQPFLTPVPPPSSHSTVLSTALLPIRYIIGLIRLTIVLLLTVCYVLITKGVCSILVVVPPLQRVTVSFTTSVIARAVLFCLGFIWIPTEIVSKKRGRIQNVSGAWKPSGGDLIISNWTSWIELLWLSYRFDPVFVLPIPESTVQSVPSTTSSPILHTPGRRAPRNSIPDVPASSRNPTSQIPITGFREVSLFTILKETGRVPSPTTAGARPRSLDEIRKTSDRPVVVFPECTTSNGRGLLRFADIFRESLPIKGWNVFVMCVRYDPPTELLRTATHSIPSSSLNPLPHLFSLVSSLGIPALTIRLLNQSESPSSPTFQVHDVIGVSSKDELAEAAAVLISQLGKFKRMTLGWEDKTRFLDFYGSKRNP
ncbi:hypothetical protein BDP27DRAFT_1314760 [Rhodocollybia butyracea]|uniref:Phospholipid/glycerol acyltransferase domain-containing protein n=1 Tax=Rhodocollybia butyracea TaxID=206335 RepID=A0A9P5Q5R8_9AGAR|nr:hypothetical protein BDP27DRAFT_1314760 [Rhodocollybia butyracea]